MAQLIKVIDRAKHHEWSLMPNGAIEVTYTVIDWHWEMIDTTPAEIAYFCGLMDNE